MHTPHVVEYVPNLFTWLQCTVQMYSFSLHKPTIEIKQDSLFLLSGTGLSPIEMVCVL